MSYARMPRGDGAALAYLLPDSLRTMCPWADAGISAVA